MTPASSHETLSVFELNRRARTSLENTLGEVWVEGELSRVSRPASGHLYFTLKDDRAQVSCALFRNRARFVAAPMREGDSVRIRAKVSVFEPRGDYQLIVEAVQEAGRGALLAALERLKTRLEGKAYLPTPANCPAHPGIWALSPHQAVPPFRMCWPYCRRAGRCWKSVCCRCRFRAIRPPRR